MLNTIIKELENKGIKVEQREITKNGVKKIGLILGDGNVRPTVYADSFEGKSVDDIVEMCVQCINNVPSFDFITENVNNADWIKANIIPCLVPKNDMDVAKRDFLDLQLIARVLVNANDDTGSFVVNTELQNGFPSILDWAIEQKNMSYSVKGMTTVLNELRPGIVPILDEDKEEMFIVCSPTKTYASSALLYPEVFKEFAERRGWSKLAIIPSSIHELIIMNADKVTDADLVRMITDVNGTEVAPEDVLSDHPYYYDLKTNKVTY